MNEKKIIEQYFNNYFSRKNKKVYNEDLITVFAVGSFLYFLMYVLLRVFTVNKFEKENIAYRLEKNPQQVNQIIKFLDEIKRTIKNDISDKKLDKAFDIIDILDKYLLSFKKSGSHEESKLILDKITSNIKSLLEEILNLYLNKDQVKKQNIFNKLRFILNQFGLMDKFELILKQVLEKSDNVIRNDNKQEVELKPETVINAVVSAPSVTNASTVETSEDEEATPIVSKSPITKEIPKIENLNIPDKEEINFSDYTNIDDETDEQPPIEEESEEDKIARQKKEQEIENENRVAKIDDIRNNFLTYLRKFPNNLVIGVVLRTLDDLESENEDLLVELYDILNLNASIEDIQKEFYQSSVGEWGLKKIESIKIIHNYNELNKFLIDKNIKNNGLIITTSQQYLNDSYYLEIKIYKNKFQEGIIVPLNPQDFDNTGFDDFYILRFIREAGDIQYIFSVFIKPDQIEQYGLYKFNSNKSFNFSLNESLTRTYSNFNVKVCTGNWKLEQDRISFTKVKFEEGFEFKEITKDNDNRVFILNGDNILTERVNKITPTIADRISENPKFYYCICILHTKNGKENKLYLIKPITVNFINVLEQIYRQNKITYINENKQKQTLILDRKIDAHEIIATSIKRTTTSGHINELLDFFEDPDSNEFPDLVFHQVNDSAISFQKKLVKIDTSKKDWMYI